MPGPGRFIAGHRRRIGNHHAGTYRAGLSDEPENLLMRHIFLDTVQLARIIMEMPQVDAQQVSVMGGSQEAAFPWLVPDSNRALPKRQSIIRSYVITSAFGR